MQSDAQDRIGEAFSPATAAFRSAVTDAIEQIRAYIDSHAKPAGSPAARAAAELGVFAAGHIDEGRFAALFADGDALDADTLRVLDRALAVLRELSFRNGPAFRVEVGPGGDVAAAVGSALASIGRAFGAARVAELVRLGRIDEARREDAAAPFPFVRWTTAERRLAPPLLVSCDGADLDASGIAPLLDGTQKIVLLVGGPAAAAPLARLITPGTFVMQTTDAAAIDRLAAFDGPGIAALMPEGSMTFVHDPSAAGSARFTVSNRPESKPRALRAASVFQQGQSLELVDLLERAYTEPAAVSFAGAADGVAAASDGATPHYAAAGVEAGAAGGATRAADPADTLAAWLLSQAGMRPAGGTAER